MFHVEHVNFSNISKKTQILMIFALSILVFAACKQRIANPELSDPIYQDLSASLKAAEGEVKNEEKTISDLKKEYAAMGPRAFGRKHKLDEINQHEKTQSMNNQRVIYYQIRLQQRLEYDQIAYERAFEADKPWPDPAEIAEYKKVKDLKAAPRTWDKRVPKSDRHSKKPAEAPKPKKSDEGESAPAAH